MDKNNRQLLDSGPSWKAARRGRGKNDCESEGSKGSGGYGESGGSVEQRNITLDAGIWGGLQDHIPLQKVHEKLPCKDFCRLRAVSKAWNRVALERLEPKPYFVTIALGSGNRYLNGVLSYNTVTGAFSWEPQHYIIREDRRSRQAANFHAPFEVDGMVFSLYPDRAMDKYGVFNIHSKTWHVIPSPQERLKMGKKVCGMTVDTSEIPYNFQLIMAGATMNTIFYDSKSRSWAHLGTELDTVGRYSLKPSPGPSYATCLCTDDYVFISHTKETILVTCIESRIWTTLQGPPMDDSVKDNNTYALGEWESRIFTTRQNKNDEYVSVWELVNTKQEWGEYARTSSEAYGWLFDDLWPRVSLEEDQEVTLKTCFCDEYLLIYCWDGTYTRAAGLVLFNLATKEWKKVDLPRGTVSYKAN